MNTVWRPDPFRDVRPAPKLPHYDHHKKPLLRPRMTPEKKMEVQQEVRALIEQGATFVAAAKICRISVSMAQRLGGTKH